MGLSFDGVHPDRLGPTAYPFHDAIKSLPPDGQPWKCDFVRGYQIVHMVLADETPWADEATAPTVPRILRIGMAGCLVGRGDFGISTGAAGMLWGSVAGISEPSCA